MGVNIRLLPPKSYIDLAWSLPKINKLSSDRLLVFRFWETESLDVSLICCKGIDWHIDDDSPEFSRILILHNSGYSFQAQETFNCKEGEIVSFNSWDYHRVVKSRDLNKVPDCFLCLCIDSVENFSDLYWDRLLQYSHHKLMLQIHQVSDLDHNRHPCQAL